MDKRKIEIVVWCPGCGRVYFQTVIGKWNGKTRLCGRRYVALRALCEENGQGSSYTTWYGVALCADCSLKRVPPTLRESLERWLREGERPCGSAPS